MSIEKLLKNEKVNFLQVNVLKQINSTQFIVGDNTGMAIMNVDLENVQHIEVGKGLKMVKPSRIEENRITCHPRFHPMKTKAMDMKVDYEKMDEMELSGKTTTPDTAGITFNQIENDFGDNAIINSVLVYITTKSRIIDGKYGSYQICNIKDTEGSSLTINLYKQNIDRLEVNKVYTLEKIKKTTIKTDSGVRMSTTNFTKIRNASQYQIDLFSNVQIADHKISGVCVMFNDLSFYKTCKKHLTKLGDDDSCTHCGQIDKDDGKADFRCALIVENTDDDSMSVIVIFKRHIEIDLTSDDDEAKVIEILEEKIVGKSCTIHYNNKGDENNVAVKVIINE